MQEGQSIRLTGLDQLVEDLYNMLYIPDYKILVYINNDTGRAIVDELCNNILPKDFIKHISRNKDKILFKNGNSVILSTDITKFRGMRFVNVYYGFVDANIETQLMLDSLVLYDPYDRLLKLKEEEFSR